MVLAKNYNPQEMEPRWQARWQEEGIYHFDPQAEGPIFSIDTPPPTVSGNLHLGHTYSYSHPDFFARFRRMRGDNIFYPMGFDDNGLPTERLVEKQLGVTAQSVGRAAFIEQCLQVSEEAEKEYQALWQRLGLSIDWRYTYRTIDERSRRASQFSFIQLYQEGRAYRRDAPAIWCPECRTSIAQAELNDLERESEFITMPFLQEDGSRLPIATTRPELLPACVAVFVHPGDERYSDLVGSTVIVPLYGQRVPVLADTAADPEKGTGVVMCCTFGDVTDVAWQQTHSLPIIEAISKDGRMTAAAGRLEGMTVETARRQVKSDLEAQGLLLGRQPVSQSVRVHERCDTPVEYLLVGQWFVRILEERPAFLKAGERINWQPEYMEARYRAWVENLGWDWCISRQRYFGVPFPVWYCEGCGEIVLADESALPVDPTIDRPGRSCPQCEGESFIPETDIFDTWATSSLSPQIVGGWLDEPELFAKVFPFSLRPQGHEIIRTWAFYTIVKSLYHFGVLPWKDVLISGWGLAGEGMGKISKSRGGGMMAPIEMIRTTSADAIRYWAAGVSTGRDAVISPEKIGMGTKLATKLWNVARFSERFIESYTPSTGALPALSAADRWILARLQRLIQGVTAAFEGYDYATAKSEAEEFFWRDLADNYLEMAKGRLYDEAHPLRAGACFALNTSLLTLIKLFAPLFPYVTEAIYQGLFAPSGEPNFHSIHRSTWPELDERLVDDNAALNGERLVEVATAVRRFKSERNLPLGKELSRLQLAVADTALVEWLRSAIPDLMGITRAREVEIVERLDPGLNTILESNAVIVAVGL